MDQIENLTQDDVLEVIKGFPLTPLRNKVIMTVNIIETDDIDLSGQAFSEVQFVLAKGSHVSDSIQPGCKILLDLEKMMVFDDVDTNAYEKAGAVKIKPVEVNGRHYALIPDSYIDCVDTREDNF